MLDSILRENNIFLQSQNRRVQRKIVKMKSPDFIREPQFYKV